MAKKIFIGFVALVLVAFVLLFQFGGRAAEELTKKLLAEQTALYQPGYGAADREGIQKAGDSAGCPDHRLFPLAKTGRVEV